MATFIENIAKIRGQAIYGPDMREAIAEAIEQSDDEVDSRIAAMQVIVDENVFYVNLEPLATSSDFRLTITGGS